MENRVLTLDEVLGLEDGRKVWVEDHDYPSLGGKHISKRGHQDGGKHIDFCLIQGKEYWPIGDEFEQLLSNHEVRVWSLPQPPTPDEIATNPWEREESK